jgi:flagellar hook-associated protein 2
VGSPITFSGFNKIDFSVVLEAVMKQERRPVTVLESQRQAVQSQKTAFSSLATKLSALESAAAGLSGDTFSGRSVTTTDASALAVTATTEAAVGTYDVVVSELARAQVTPMVGTAPDRDSTVVATGGTLVIGGQVVTLTGAVTLEGLADAINDTPNMPVAATIVSPSAGVYQLVLTGKRSGASNAFAVTNNLTGGTGVAFGAPVVAASNATFSVNNIDIESEANTVEGAIAGTTISLLKKNPGETVTIAIGQDYETSKANVKKFVSAYNDLVKFLADQRVAAGRADSTAIGHDFAVSGVRSTLLSKLTGEYEMGGDFSHLAAAGLEFTRTGELTFNETVFDDAVADAPADVAALFGGSGGSNGAFDEIKSVVTAYTQSGGVLSSRQTTLTTQMQNLTRRIDDYERGLAVRRAALQKEFIAADQAMSALNQQVASLSSLGSQYRLF